MFALRQCQRPEEIKKKIKLALALLLFKKRVISQGKAAELAEMTRARFMEVLKEHGIPTFEYEEKDYQRDQQIRKNFIDQLTKEGFRISEKLYRQIFPESKATRR